jgi:hypothetical protein
MPVLHRRGADIPAMATTAAPPPTTGGERAVRRFLGVAVLALAMTLALVAVPGGQGSATGAPVPYVPPAGPMFNDPYSANYPQRAIEDHIEAMINGSPAGSTIRVATLGIDVPSATAALVAAHRRGVVVRVVVPASIDGRPDIDRLQRVLGTDPAGGGSYVAVCQTSCYASDVPFSTMHAKIYMFSETGTATKVVTLSSANLTTWAVTMNWNDAYTFVGNERAYLTTRQYFDSLRFDTPKPLARTRNVGRGDRIYYYPDPAYTRATDVFTTLLKGTACKNARSGPSVAGKTVIKVATSRWGVRRLDVARRLGRLVARGCRVQVLVQFDTTAPEVLAELEAAGVPTRYSDGPDGTKPNNHSKYVAVSGVVDGDHARSTVVTGSLNLTGAERKSDNVVVRVADSAWTFRRYAESFQPIYRQSSPVTPAVVAQRRRQVAGR